MDHHCKPYIFPSFTETLLINFFCLLLCSLQGPWIDTCVGHFNQKYFLLFLFYSSITQAWGGIMYAIEIVRMIRHAAAQPARSENDPTLDFPLAALFIVINMVFLVCLCGPCFSIFFLFIFFIFFYLFKPRSISHRRSCSL